MKNKYTFISYKIRYWFHFKIFLINRISHNSLKDINLSYSFKTLFSLFILFSLINISAFADDSTKFTIDTNKVYKVYQFEIKEEIAPPVMRKTQKAFKQAEEEKADLILIHMNTYGGMVKSADSIRTKILNSKIPVIDFIDNNAASAGALISIACDSIYMRPGANIGAATVVNQKAEAMPDKYQSYMRSIMRSTAEAKGRNPNIAQAMVDPRIAIKGITDSGRVITFTTSEAIKYGFCEGQAENTKEVLKLYGLKKYKIIKQKLTAIDRFIGFLINPIISGILIIIIIAGIYFEFQTPGVGFPLAASVFAALLYFAPLYLEGLAENWEILIFIIGLILVAIEIFVIPGFGVTGILGIIFIILGLSLSMVNNTGLEFHQLQLNGLLKAFFIVIIASFISIVLSFYLSKKLFTSKSTIFGKLALNTIQEKNKGFTSSDVIYKKMIGKIGVAHTILRPVGKVEIDDDIFDATAEMGYIEKGEKIIVTKYETSQLFVKKLHG